VVLSFLGISFELFRFLKRRAKRSFEFTRPPGLRGEEYFMRSFIILCLCSLISACQLFMPKPPLEQPAKPTAEPTFVSTYFDSYRQNRTFLPHDRIFSFEVDANLEYLIAINKIGLSESGYDSPMEDKPHYTFLLTPEGSLSESVDGYQILKTTIKGGLVFIQVQHESDIERIQLFVAVRDKWLNISKWPIVQLP
jgi:hypothetical protein